MTELRSRRPLLVMLAAAVIAIIVGAFVPPVIINSMKPLSTDYVGGYSTDPAPTLMADLAALRAGQVPAERADDPACGAEDPDFSCFVSETTSRLERGTATAPVAETGREAWVEAETRLLGEGSEPLLEIGDRVRVTRRSTYPVAQPASRLTFTLPRVDGEIDTGEFARSGLQYFFPFAVERRSYDRFDPLTRRADPIDFVGELPRNGLDTYQFHHRLSGLPLADPLASAYSPTGQEQAHYAVDRTVWVEPESGIILDSVEEFHVYLAADGQQARQRADRPEAGHTIYHATLGWDEETRAAQHDLAAPLVSQLRGLQVLATLSKTLGIVLLITAAVLFVRRRGVEAP